MIGRALYAAADALQVSLRGGAGSTHAASKVVRLGLGLEVSFPVRTLVAYEVAGKEYDEVGVVAHLRGDLWAFIVSRAALTAAPDVLRAVYFAARGDDLQVFRGDSESAVLAKIGKRRHKRTMEFDQGKQVWVAVADAVV